MDGDRCKRTNCDGTIEDGYCNVCGHAEVKGLGSGTSPLSTGLPLTGRNGSGTVGTAGSALTNRGSKGSRRTSSSARSSRRQLGAGIVSVPELPSTEPEKLILAHPQVPENKRFCANCNQSLRREKGFCSQCGQKYSFVPSLHPGDLVANQYQVKGAMAYGGLGWIYLGFDNTLSRYVVLKGLLNTEDAASAAVAVAERQFLAAVKHANIVGIYNFVRHGTEGFIVMEFVGGQTLKEIRKTRGPLPVAEAIAYIHRILGAFAYLHTQGLVYCDFKPDNIMLEGHDVKLIDMGGVRRLDDPDGDIYGTVGYSAPEAGEGPTVVSDLFTIGRTLAVLLVNIPRFSSDYQYTLPSPQAEPLFVRYESLYRFLLKATAPEPDDRFQSADEMADQLMGILREVVSIETETPHPSTSTVFGGDRLALTSSSDFESVKVDYQHVPWPLLDTQDPAFNPVVNATAIANLSKQADELRQIIQQSPTSREAPLRLVNIYIDLHHFHKAEPILTALEQADVWDWRVGWYRGRSLLAQGKGKEAMPLFEQVYTDLPGEMAPKLALALASEQTRLYDRAAQLYRVVWQTDPNYPTAAFGLARCLYAQGDRTGAVNVLQSMPQTSNLYTRSRVESARLLINREAKQPPGAQELKQASDAIQTLTIAGMDRHRLTRQFLETALELLMARTLAASHDIQLLGQPLQEVHLRQELEKVLRAMAHLTTGAEKIQLVDEANRVRPRTLL